jgi:hypothetical protein
VNSGGLNFHKWRVVVDFAGDKCVGGIVGYRGDYHEERKAYKSKTPFTRLWKCVFEGDDEGDYEEYDAKDLSVHMSRAQREGCPGPDADDQPHNQLEAVPKSAGGGTTGRATATPTTTAESTSGKGGMGAKRNEGNPKNDERAAAAVFVFTSCDSNPK